MREFWLRGYHATSIPKLESAMGINRQSLYDTFQNKQTLFLHVLQYYHENIIVKNFSYIEQASSPRQGIRSYFSERAKDALSKGEILGCLVTNSIAELAQHDQAIQRQTNVTLKHMIKVFKDTLIRAQKANEISQNIDVESTADMLVNCAQGLFVLSRTNVTGSSVRGIVKQIENLLDK